MQVEPYKDASGAGMMTTASIAQWDTQYTPAKLIFVAGVDILMTELLKIEPNAANMLKFIVDRSNRCPTTASAGKRTYI